MAGDWIKMRTRLHEDPAVERLIELTGLDSFAVIGRLHRIWSWANEQLRDGYARALQAVRIDARVAHDGFARAMEQVGWLVIEDDGIRFPRWNSHNSKSAKQRALARERMRRHRDARSVTRASPEKRREEKRITTPQTPLQGRGALSKRALRAAQRQQQLEAEAAKANERLREKGLA